MADFTPEQEKEFEFRLRYEQEQADAQKQQAKQEEQTNAVDRARSIGIPVGAIAGAGTHIAGKTADVGRFLTGQKYDPSGFYGRGAPPMEKYGRSMNLQHTGEQKWFGGKEMDEVYDRMRQAHKDPTLAAQYEKEALQQMRPVRRTAEKLATSVPESLRGVLTNPMGFLGKGIMGAGAGMQAADAAARYGNNDTTGAIISGIGALGTAASMIPHPIARVGGTAVGLGAEGLNMFLDKLKKKSQMAKGGLVDEEDGLSKAEKAALRIMKSKKKVDHLANGGQPDIKDFTSGALRGIAPHGFRHIEKVEDVSLPKGSGWFGYLPNKTGQVSTEISVDNNGRQYPMINPAMSHQEINSLLANEQPTDAMYNRAEQWADYRKNQGKSPFIEYGELKWAMPRPHKK